MKPADNLFDKHRLYVKQIHHAIAGDGEIHCRGCEIRISHAGRPG